MLSKYFLRAFPRITFPSPFPRFDFLSPSPRNAKTRRLSVAEPGGRVSTLGLAGVLCVAFVRRTQGTARRALQLLSFTYKFLFRRRSFSTARPGRRDVCAPFSARLTRGRKRARRRRFRRYLAQRRRRKSRRCANRAARRNRRRERRQNNRSTGRRLERVEAKRIVCVHCR